MEDTKAAEAVQTSITDLEPSPATFTDDGPVFALRGQIPSAPTTTRAGVTDEDG